MKQFSIPMRERYEIISEVFTLIEDDESSIETVLTTLGSKSAPITSKFIQYLNTNTFYTSKRHSGQIHTLQEGIRLHGFNPFIEVILNMKSSRVPNHFFKYFPTLSQETCTYMKECFSGKVNHINIQKNQNYAILFGLDALIYLEADYKKVEEKHLESNCHKFKFPIHKNISKFGEIFSLPQYITERENNTTNIPGVSFSNYDVTQIINCVLGIKEKGFLGENELIISSEKLKENKSEYVQKLVDLLEENQELASIISFFNLERIINKRGLK